MADQSLTISASVPLVERSLSRVVSWVERSHYRGYEPADGNLSFLHSLTFGKVFPMRALQQIVLRSPVNVRPFIGVPRHESAIARGYMAWGYLIMSRRGTVGARNKAVSCLDWLIANPAPRFDEFCWGDPYDYATRGGRRPYGAPLLIWSALIGQAFLDAFESLGDRRYLDVAESVGRWILRLPVEQTDAGLCLSYNAYRQTSIHNSNAMGAAFLARLGSITGSGEAMARARDAMLYTCSRQRADGSWYYAEDPKFHWIDNFHTGYNLSALRVYQAASQDRTFDEHLVLGTHYFKTRFFEPDGRAKYFHDRTYPIDIQCAAQAIETLTTLSDRDPDCLPLAARVAEWTVAHMQDEDGHFYFRDLGWMRVKTPLLHWGQATMAKALAVLLNKLTVVDA
jgi:rhamnogalacturonyl hydrolase YesR